MRNPLSPQSTHPAISITWVFITPELRARPKGRMLASFIPWRQGDAYRLATAGDLVDERRNGSVCTSLRAKSESCRSFGNDPADWFARSPCCRKPCRRRSADPGEPLDHNGRRRKTRWFALIPSVPSCRFQRTAQPRWDQSCQDRSTGWSGCLALAGRENRVPLVTATERGVCPANGISIKVGGVSFHKGCYPGQKSWARTQYLGKGEAASLSCR